MPSNTFDDSTRVWKVLQHSSYNEDGSLWAPKILPQEWLDANRRTMGPYLFAAQYLNQAIADEERRYMPEWIRYKDMYLTASEGRLFLCVEAKLLPVVVFTLIDPAISKQPDADFTALVTVAVDSNSNWYVLSARRFRGSAHTVRDEGIAEIKKFHTGILGVETVAYQKALHELIYNKCHELGLRVGVVELKSGSGKSKRARIEGMVAQFANGQVWFSDVVDKTLESELLLWSPSRETGHDDLVDALSHLPSVAFPAPMDGAYLYGMEWHDLPPKEREKLRRKKEQQLGNKPTAGVSSGYDRTGSTFSPLKPRSKKEIEKEEKEATDIRLTWPELADELKTNRIRRGYGA